GAHSPPLRQAGDQAHRRDGRLPGRHRSGGRRHLDEHHAQHHYAVLPDLLSRQRPGHLALPFRHLPDRPGDLHHADRRGPISFHQIGAAASSVSPRARSGPSVGRARKPHADHWLDALGRRGRGGGGHHCLGHLWPLSHQHGRSVCRRLHCRRGRGPGVAHRRHRRRTLDRTGRAVHPLVLVGHPGPVGRHHHPGTGADDSAPRYLHQERRAPGLMPRLRSLRPQETLQARFMCVLVLTILVLAVTFFLPPVADSQLAGGAAIAIVILGLSWLIGWSGQISLGNSGFMAVGAYAAGIWAHHHASTPLIFTFVLAMVMGALSGLVIAIPSTRLRGPYLAGMTLAFSAAITPLAQNFTSVTGGEGGLFFNQLTTPTWFAHLF